jgi:hypothetical protein
LGECNRFRRCVRADVNDDLFPRRRIFHRDFSDEFALCGGLQHAFAGRAAQVNALHISGVNSFEQSFERRHIEVAFSIKRRQ